MHIFSKEIGFKDQPKDVVIYITLLAAFVFFFLSIYKPFFLQKINSQDLQLLILKVSLATLVLGITGFIAGIRLFHINQKRWTLGNDIVWNLSHFLVISVFNYVFCQQIDSLVDYRFYQILLATILVGSIPVSIDLMFRINKHHGKELPVHYPNATKSLILFVESQGNYINVYTNDGDATDKTMQRYTLVKFLDEHKDVLVQVHRKYLVNIQQIKDISGNSAGGYVLLSNNKKVPFSRSFSKQVMLLKEQDHFASKMILFQA